MGRQRGEVYWCGAPARNAGRERPAIRPRSAGPQRRATRAARPGHVDSPRRPRADTLRANGGRLPHDSRASVAGLGTTPPIARNYSHETRDCSLERPGGRLLGSPSRPVAHGLDRNGWNGPGSADPGKADGGDHRPHRWVQRFSTPVDGAVEIPDWRSDCRRPTLGICDHRVAGAAVRGHLEHLVPRRPRGRPRRRAAPPHHARTRWSASGSAPTTAASSPPWSTRSPATTSSIDLTVDAGPRLDEPVARDAPRAGRTADRGPTSASAPARRPPTRAGAHVRRLDRAEPPLHVRPLRHRGVEPLRPRRRARRSPRPRPAPTTRSSSTARPDWARPTSCTRSATTSATCTSSAGSGTSRPRRS